jgi:hypothetical protein
VVRLSEDEYTELRKAVSEASVPNVSLLVFQAIQTGLEGDETHRLQRKRTRIIYIHVSREFMEKIRNRAASNHVSQQALVRGLLFHYIRNRGWELVEAEPSKQAAGP